MDLQGRAALVTGGSRGIGYAIAERLIAGGADVAITSVDEGRLGRAAASLGCSAAVRADARSSSQVAAAVDEAAASLGRLDVLVNNAAVFPPQARTEDVSDADWDDTIGVNLSGPFRFMRAAVPHMLRGRHGGSVVNVSSIAGLRPLAYAKADAYAASKAALNMLTRTWALQYAPDRIRVNAVCPGSVETDMTAASLATAEGRRAKESRIPWGRIGGTGDIAAAVAFLASGESAWTTGAVLAVDGGQSLA